ncbi:MULTISPECIES: restriction endonuclease [unclassified Bradyrhizobium]|uniref:restriction endonuclease n=1 Tax=unclassified Bradyrhizobium TaxID=2631580 RepID=UPI0033951FD1
MPYEFGNLSPADFEDLARDLVGRELGVRFEAFAAAPDGGMDGRHAKGGAKIILQAKHYAGSTYPASNQNSNGSVRRLIVSRLFFHFDSDALRRSLDCHPIAERV